MGLKKVFTNPIADSDVSIKQIRNLIKRYYHQMKKKKPTADQPLDPANDARSVWFWKEKLDELFRVNGYSDSLSPEEKKDFGIRVYFGVHHKGQIISDIPDNYDNQQMVVLVVTKFNGVDHVDILTEESTVEIAGTIFIEPGKGMNHGKLCPPESGCLDGSALSFNKKEDLIENQ